VAPRGLRRDARRNYERIVAAARDVFGESGADAAMEEIAARAGVGVGITVADVTALASGLRGLIHAGGGGEPDDLAAIPRPSPGRHGRADALGSAHSPWAYFLSE
jgi:hypothetical protein